jgi:hypothetical protein
LRVALRCEFTGKSGKQWKLQVEDKRITGIVKRCADIPGHGSSNIWATIETRGERGSSKADSPIPQGDANLWQSRELACFGARQTGAHTTHRNRWRCPAIDMQDYTESAAADDGSNRTDLGSQSFC